MPTSSPGPAPAFCIVPLADGSDCYAQTVMDAPFPICGEHLTNIYVFAEERATGELRSIYARVFGDDEAAARRLEFETRQAQHMSTDATVYYLRVRDLIKIGVTVDLQRRLAHLFHDELLATEPGGYDLEAQRHAEFMDLRYRGEYFHADPRLLTHIEQVRHRHGPPIVKRFPIREMSLLG